MREVAEVCQTKRSGLPCNLEQKDKPRLLVTVDTEEEFDWSGGFSRQNTSVQAMRWIVRAQHLFDEYHITPTYVVDYPVVSQPAGYRPLQEIHSEGRCLIGAHLHPWVNPPHQEAVGRYLSFPGNLPREVESEKLRVLGEAIAERFAARPTVYKAGRYGVGPHTAEILDGLGYEVDLSVCPCMDYSAEGGPDFRGASAWPYWFGREHRLLELPLTVGFAGALRHWGGAIHDLASKPPLGWLRSVGILARLGLVDKIWLSPEGYTSAEHRKLVGSLYRDGLRVFSFAFHSPSLEPGWTPYVRSSNDLDSFLGRCRDFFDYFCGHLGGVPATPLELKNVLAPSREQAA